MIMSDRSQTVDSAETLTAKLSNVELTVSNAK